MKFMFGVTNKEDKKKLPKITTTATKIRKSNKRLTKLHHIWTFKWTEVLQILECLVKELVFSFDVHHTKRLK